MASRLSKFRPRILVSSIVVFILLSVSSSGEERRRCYWCGPLAEQVHRSQRAPSCDIFDLEQHETVCDEGYTHCATIAASPPYAESRLCVKFYQDECYSLYCNSTKTWRMVCACRGDLCNGPHTDRETEAFALVPKFLAKTKPRNKRSLISGFMNVKTKAPSDNVTIIIISNKSYNDTTNIVQSDQPLETENTTNTVFSHMPKHIEENTIIEHGTFKNAERNIAHTSPSKNESNEESKTYNAPSTMPPMEDKHLEIVNKISDKAETKIRLDNAKTDTYLNHTEIDKHVNNVNTDKDVDSAEMDKDVNNSKTKEHMDNANMDRHIDNAEINKHDDNMEIDKHLDNSKMDTNLNNVKTGKHLDSAKLDKITPTLEYTTPGEFFKESNGAVTASTSIKPTSIEIEVAVVHSNVIPGKLPPAEALQQNVTPTKAMVVTSMENVNTSTENNHIETTLPSERDKQVEKNSGAQNLAHLFALIISTLVYPCL